MAVERNDEADAQLVADVAAALRSWQSATGMTPATKVLREAVWFFWQKPRLGDTLVRSKYPRKADWSPRAAALVQGGADLRGQLVIEHVEPMKNVLHWLIETHRTPQEVVLALRERLRVVVVTREENALLKNAATPEQRYEAAGLDLKSFAPLLP